jgi:circadian clock protein KaiC
VRLLEVVKQRGRAQLGGLHSYRLDGQGISVLPRLEVYPQPEARPKTHGRAPFGLPTLDELLRGGFNTGTTALLAGAPGVGKTTLAIYWALAEARPDAVSLFVTFSEHLEQLERKAAAFGLNLQEACTQGAVRVLRIPATELNPDYVAMLILHELAAAPVRRLIIDDIAILMQELGERSRDYISALNDILYGADITSLYLLEIPAFDGLRLELSNTPLALLGDNTLVVQQYEIGGVLRRLLAVLRMRLSFFDKTLRELVLDENGVRVLAPQESEQGVLAAGAELSGGVAPKDASASTDEGGTGG